MENATIEKLNGAINQLMDAYEKLQNQYKNIEKENNNLKLIIRTLENDKKNLSSNSTEQSTKINSMLGKIESLLSPTTNNATNISVEPAKPQVIQTESINFDDDSSKIADLTTTNIPDKKVEKEDDSPSSLSNIDLGRMEKMLNGIKQ